MNDQQMFAELRSIHEGRRHVPDAPAVKRQLLALPLREVAPQRGWLPRLGAGRFSMFSATKFVVAGAVVALFGGSLLSGVLTQQPSDDRLPVGASASATIQAEPTDAAMTGPEPTTQTHSNTTDLLSGVDLVTEEVEPGVYRVLSDGAGHDLVAEPPSALLFAQDGQLVLFSGRQEDDTGWPLGFSSSIERFYALGQAGESAVDRNGEVTREFFFDAAFDGDGNLIAKLDAGPEPNRLVMYDGEEWRQLGWPNGSSKASAVETAPDGTVFVTKHNMGSGPRVARFEDGALSVLPVLDDGSRAGHTGSEMAIAPDGTIWVANLDIVSWTDPETKGLVYFDGETWREPDLPLPDEPRSKQFGPMAIGPDGTLWVYVTAGRERDRTLLRLRDGEWSAFTGDDGPPQLWAGQGFVARLAVDSEGMLWIAASGREGMPPSLGPSEGPPGILAFDGSTWRQFLAGHFVNRVQVDEGGSVWATSLAHCDDLQGRECRTVVDGGLYVITPEAVAASD